MHMDSYYRHPIGYRATNAENLADKLQSLYAGSMVFELDRTSRGETPGADPTRRQRGPRS